MIRKNKQPLSTQIKTSINKRLAEAEEEKTHPKQGKEYDGDINNVVSTGSTLLDLAISGGRIEGGGIPGGILVEVFGPNSAGKTVLLCEIAGAIQRKGGNILFHDPEARLNKQFARIFDFNTDKIKYTTPDTVTEVFTEVRKWEPTGKGINGIITDSLAALSTDLEMDNDEGDKMGMRRAKEFSEQLRKTARILTKNGWLMVCSNQIRENTDATGYGEKVTAPGGKAIGFYASLRIRARTPEKITVKSTYNGKEVKRVIGVKTEFEVYKSSVWKPYRAAPLYIIFDYGVDDIRANLQYVKDYTKSSIYTCGDIKLSPALEVACRKVEEQKLEKKLKKQVVEIWKEIEALFESERAPKRRE